MPASFIIDGGVLKLQERPRLRESNGPGTKTPALLTQRTTNAAGGANNVYRVTVRFGAGGEDGAPDVHRQL